MRLLVAGGGTGGHLFPGIAIAEEFLSRERGNEVLFVGTRAGIEARVLPVKNLPHRFIDIGGLKGVGLAARLKNLLKLPMALWSSLSIVRDFRPDVVIGVGGYASGPVVLAARLLGRYTAVQEQNSHAGFTNRILGKLVRRIFLGFEAARRQFPAARTVFTGNPIRTEIRSRAKAAPPLPQEPAVTILGGSQGARVLNERMPEVWKRIGGQVPGLKWTHQCGRGNLAVTRSAYAGAPAGVEVIEFVDDMAALIERSSLVVGRSGASTVAELAAFGRPAVFVPFPFATDDHQTTNAMDCVNAGGSVVIAQKDATVEHLSAEILGLLRDPERLKIMGEDMRRFGRPDAAREIVDTCFRDLGRSGGQHDRGQETGGQAA